MPSLSVDKALPEKVREGVRRLITSHETERIVPDENEQVERVQQMENVIAPLREPLPEDYKFDREEANER